MRVWGLLIFAIKLMNTLAIYLDLIVNNPL